MSTISQLKKVMPPGIYNELIPKVELTELSLIEINCSVDRVRLDKLNEFKIRIVDEYEAFVENKDGINRIHGKIVLDVPVRGKSKNPLIIEAVYSARFQHDCKLPNEFWEVYKEVTFPFQIWPYFRELVQTTTAKMNIKPLTLPILH